MLNLCPHTAHPCAAATLSPAFIPPNPKPPRWHSHFKAQYLDGLKGQLVARESNLDPYSTDIVLVVRGQGGSFGFLTSPLAALLQLHAVPLSRHMLHTLH